MLDRCLKYESEGFDVNTHGNYMREILCDCLEGSYVRTLTKV